MLEQRENKSVSQPFHEPIPEGWKVLWNANGEKTVISPDEQAIQTEYSLEFLEQLFAIKRKEGDCKGKAIWYSDELNRPAKLYGFLDSLIGRYLDPGSVGASQALDFGAGVGASSVCLARMGFKSVVGVEINPHYVKAAKLRARDMGLNLIQFIHLGDSRLLPFENDRFAVVVCSGVIEHMLPSLRKQVIGEIWRVLAPDGILIITETPNLLFPYGCHFPFLLFTPWMPIGVVKLYGYLRGSVQWDTTTEELYLRGVRGCTLWHVLRWIDGPAIVVNGLHSRFEEEYLARAAKKGDGGMKLIIKRLIVAISKNLLAPIGIPFCAIFPFLNLVIRKPYSASL